MHFELHANKHLNSHTQKMHTMCFSPFLDEKNHYAVNFFKVCLLHFNGQTILHLCVLRKTFSNNNNYF